MPDKERTVGGSAATGVGNSWMQMLQGLMQTGQMSNAPMPTTSAAPNITDKTFNNDKYNQMINAVRAGGNPSGVGGTPGANPGGGMEQTNGFAQVINQLLGQNPANQFYTSPNNPRPDGAISDVANMQFDPMTFATPEAGRSDAYNSALGGMGGIADLLKQIASSSANGGNLLPGPASLNIGDFSSQGLMGDRSNVLNAITDAARTQRSDAIADANERLTAMGGQGGVSTAAGFERAITNQRADQGLAETLAGQDLGYRNLDLNAWNSKMNALLGNRNIDAYVHGNMLQAMNQGNNSAINALLGGGDVLKGILGAEFGQQGLASENQLATNKLNLESGLGFGELNSKNATSAADLMTRLFGMQGNLDQNAQQLAQNGQMGIMQMLFQALNGAAQQGLPQAGTVMQPNALGQVAQGAAGIFGNIFSPIKL